MTTARELMPDVPSNSGERGVALQCQSSPDGFLWRQLGSAGLAAIAEKVAAGHDLELDEALVLSRASMPLLAKIVELRPAVSAGEEVVAAAGLPIDRASTSPVSPKNIGLPLADWDSFCRALIAIRNEVRPNGATTAWYPILGKPLDPDHDCEGGFTGVEVLRAIALARLLLPAGVEVRAPLATLGPKLAQVALDFGAAHLGWVAPDGQTPADPLVADASLLDELLGSCLPTVVGWDQIA